MYNDKNTQKFIVQAALGIIIISGVIMLCIFLLSGWGLPWKIASTNIISDFARHPATPIVATMLFFIGVVLCLYVANPITVLFLLPLALVAILPVTSNQDFTPAKVVVAFDREDCPEGWNEFTPLAGRVVVGTGNAGIDDGGRETETRVYKESAGEEKHKLLIPEMPNHAHMQVVRQVPKHGRYNTSMGSGWDLVRNLTRAEDGGLTKDKGGEDAHNNMQPYYVLTYCRKMTPAEIANKEKEK